MKVQKYRRKISVRGFIRKIEIKDIDEVGLGKEDGRLLSSFEFIRIPSDLSLDGQSQPDKI